MQFNIQNLIIIIKKLVQKKCTVYYTHVKSLLFLHQKQKKINKTKQNKNNKKHSFILICKEKS